MKARLYEIEVSTDVIHGWSAAIKEVYIPSARISFNIMEGEVHVFKTYNHRYDGKFGAVIGEKGTPAKLIKEFEIEDSMVEWLGQHIFDTQQIERAVKQIMKGPVAQPGTAADSKSAVVEHRRFKSAPGQANK